jgi:ATPase family associated with various cellular activities (AAA)
MTALASPAAVPTSAEQARPALLADVDRIKLLLAAHCAGERQPTVPRVPAPGPVDTVVERLGLSAFERDVLLLAAAVELDGEVAALVGKALGTGDPRPTFALAMAALPEPHWDALTPDRPLRRWRLLTLHGSGALATRPLAVDEHVLHLLTGLTGTHSGLDGLVAVQDELTSLAPSQLETAEELAAAVASLRGRLLVRLDGDDRDARSAVAAHLATRLGLELLVVQDAALAEADLASAATVLDREALLGERLLVTGNERLLALLRSRVVVTDGPAENLVTDRTVVARTVDLPTGQEQVATWLGTMDAELVVEPALDTAVREVAHHYRLSARSIRAIAAEWSATAQGTPDDLRRLARERARVGLGALAERVDPRAGWEDLVLPEGQLRLLRDLAGQVRHRSLVYDEWGFGRRANRGFGVTALFAGESGTGKTMAAEVIAGDLGLDLYRIDLSAVVSKYIGETEKNLRRLFDAAEAGGAVLLFDEADALFGRRSEVKDSHDRYANLEVAYLLQRMEGYRGLAILTTNLRSNVDTAFLRRLRFVVQFPFPDRTLRAELWRRAFPPQTPTEELDPVQLAELQISGGSIHAVAVSAAFAAAEQGRAVSPEHVLHGARVEYAKAERTLTDVETGALARRARGAR